MKHSRFGLVIESPDVTPAQVARMLAAVLIQAARDFCSVWDREVPEIRLFSSESEVPADWILVVFLPSSDVANALGYHSETPEGRVFARIFTQGMRIPEIQETFSHEILEALGDPSCNQWRQNPAGDLWAEEVADAAQGQAYTIDLGDGGDPVQVADFVTPAFFDWDPPAGASFNFNQASPIGAPFTLAPGGYTVIMAGGKTVQKLGAAVDLSKLAQKAHVVARGIRRLTSQGGLPCSEK